VNQRTGRCNVTKGYTSYTYLNQPTIVASMSAIEADPNGPESIYHCLLVAILDYFFCQQKGPGDITRYHVVQKASSLEPGRQETAIQCYQFDALGTWCLSEVRTANGSWADAKRDLSLDGQNTPGVLYGIVLVGMYLQFFVVDYGHLIQLTEKLHIKDDVETVTDWLMYIRNNFPE
jgi:hypothetical protein